MFFKDFRQDFQKVFNTKELSSKWLSSAPKFLKWDVFVRVLIGFRDKKRYYLIKTKTNIDTSKSDQDCRNSEILDIQVKSLR